MVEAFKSYRGKKKKITDRAQFNILTEFAFRADNNNNNSSNSNNKNNNIMIKLMTNFSVKVKS